MIIRRNAALAALLFSLALFTACFFPGYNPYDTSGEYDCKLVPEAVKRGQQAAVHVDPPAEDLFITYQGQVVPSDPDDRGAVHTFTVPKSMKSGELLVVIGQRYIKLKISVTD